MFQLIGFIEYTKSERELRGRKETAAQKLISAFQNCYMFMFVLLATSAQSIAKLIVNKSIKNEFSC